MTLNITKPSDAIPVKSINVLIYGTPGIGKTSIACSANNPLLLDFDKGAHRSAFRCDTLLVDDWHQVASLNPKDIAQYDTIILDTVGRLLDLLTARLQDDNRHRHAVATGLGCTQSHFRRLDCATSATRQRRTHAGARQREAGR